MSTEDLPEDYDYMKIKGEVTEIMHNNPALVNIYEEFCIRTINTLYYTLYSDEPLYNNIISLFSKYQKTKWGATRDEINTKGFFYFNDDNETSIFISAINNLNKGTVDKILLRQIIYKQFFVYTLKGGRALRIYIDFLNTYIPSPDDKFSPDEITEMLGKKSDYDSNLLINPYLDDKEYFELYNYLKQICWKVLYGSLNDAVFQSRVSSMLYNGILEHFMKNSNIDLQRVLEVRKNKSIKNWDGTFIDNPSENNISGRVQVSRINSFEGIQAGIVNGKLFELLRLMTTFLYKTPSNREAFDGELIDISFIPKYYTEKPIISGDRVVEYVPLSEADGAKQIKYGNAKFGIINDRAIADWEHSKKNIYTVTNLQFYEYTFISSYTLDDLLDDIKRVITETETGLPMGADITKLAKRKKRYSTLIKLLCTRPETMKIEKASSQDLLDKCASTLQNICGGIFSEEDWEFLYPFLFQRSSQYSIDILKNIFIYYADQYYKYLIINPFTDIPVQNQIKNLENQTQYIKLVNRSDLIKEYVHSIFDNLDGKFMNKDLLNIFCCNCILHFNRLMNSFNDEILRLGVLCYFLSCLYHFTLSSLTATTQPIEIVIAQFIGQIQNNIKKFYDLRGKSITYPILQTFSSLILTSIVEEVKKIPTPKFKYNYSLRVKGGLAFEMMKNVINGKALDAYDDTFQTNDLDLQLFIERTPNVEDTLLQDRYFSDSGVFENIIVILSNIAKNLTNLTNNQFVFYPNIIDMGRGAIRIQLICINGQFTSQIDPIMGQFQPIAFQHILELDVTFIDDPEKKEQIIKNCLSVGTSGIYIDSPLALYNTFNQILNENLYFIRKEKYLNRISTLFGIGTLSLDDKKLENLSSDIAINNLQIQLQQAQIEKQQYATALANLQYEQMEEKRRTEIITQLRSELETIAADPRVSIVLILPIQIQNQIAQNYAQLRLSGNDPNTAFQQAIVPFMQFIALQQLELELKAISADPRVGIVLTLPIQIKNQIAINYAQLRLSGLDLNTAFQQAVAPFNQLIALQPQIITRKHQAQQQLTARVQDATQKGYSQEQILSLPNVQALQQIIASPTAGLAGGGSRFRLKTQRRPRYATDQLEKKMEEVLANARRKRRAHTRAEKKTQSKN